MSDPLISTLAGVVTNATPLVIAAMGETITERAGIVNLSLDGSIVLSAMSGFVVAYSTQQLLVANAGMTAPEAAGLSVVVGAIGAMVVGALVALLIAFSSISLRQDQVAIGFVLTLLGVDLAVFLGTNYARIPGPQILPTDIPLLANIPVIGEIFFQQSWFAYISYLLVFGTWWVFFRTRQGLSLRAVGEHPRAAETVGIDVIRLRYKNVIGAGGLASLGGAFLSMEATASFQQGMTAGRGFIGLAAMIVGRWSPLGAFGAALLFASAQGLGQSIKIVPPAGELGNLLGSLPGQFFDALPYVVTIVVLAGLIGRSIPPAADGQPYEREATA